MEELEEKLSQFNDGRIHWTELGKLLSDAQLNGVDLKNLDIDERKARSILSAFRFVEMRRPDFIKDPVLKVTHWSVSRLPCIYSKMNGESKEEDFESLIDDVLAGKFNAHDLQKLSNRIDPSLSETRERAKRIREFDKKDKAPKSDSQRESASYVALEKGLDVLDFLVESAIEHNSYETLRKHLADKCDKLAVKLNCIADEEYHRQWENRRGFTI